MPGDLGEVVLRLTTDIKELQEGLDRAKGATDEFVSDSKEQSGGLADIWKSAFAVISAAGILMAVEGFKKIIAAGTEMLDAFAADERATVTLTLALASNKNATDSTALSLHNWAEEMQKVTEFSHSQIETSAVLLASMGMSEEQIKRTMTAAMNFASELHIGLETAVIGLARSMETGSAGILGRHIPAIAAMSKEALLAGDAITYGLAGSFKNAAVTIGKTTEGLQAEMGHLIEDQKVKIGAAIAESYVGVQNLSSSIKTIGDIAAFAVGVLVKSLLTLVEWMKFQYTLFVDFFKLVAQLTIDVARVLWAPIEWAFHDVIQGIKMVFVDAINWIIDKANSILPIHIGHIQATIDAVKPLGDTLKKIWSDAQGQMKNFGDAVVKGAKDIVDIWTVSAPKVAGDFKKVQDAVGSVGDKTLIVARGMDTGWSRAVNNMIVSSHEGFNKIVKDIDANTQHMEDLWKKTLAEMKEKYGSYIDFATGLTKSFAEEIGTALGAGTLSWKTFGEAGLHAIGKIISAIGDHLAALAAADIVKAYASLATWWLAWQAPGYFASAAREGAGAMVAWTAGAALSAIKLAQGGDFTVPPGYPNDSFPMRVQSGEHVSVTPAGQGGGEQVIHVHNFIDGRSIGEFVTKASRDKKILIYARSVIP